MAIASLTTFCLLGVMFLSYEHNSATNDIDRKKNGLYIKIEHGVQEEEGDRDNRGRATTAIVLDQSYSSSLCICLHIEDTHL